MVVGLLVYDVVMWDCHLRQYKKALLHTKYNV